MSLSRAEVAEPSRAPIALLDSADTSPLRATCDMFSGTALAHRVTCIRRKHPQPLEPCRAWPHCQRAQNVPGTNMFLSDSAQSKMPTHHLAFSVGLVFISTCPNISSLVSLSPASVRIVKNTSASRVLFKQFCLYSLERT